MSAVATSASRTWSVGRYRCTLVIPRPVRDQLAHVLCTWSPSKPKRLSDPEIAAYQRGLAVAVAEISAELGIGTERDEPHP